MRTLPCASAGMVPCRELSPRYSSSREVLPIRQAGMLQGQSKAFECLLQAAAALQHTQSQMLPLRQAGMLQGQSEAFEGLLQAIAVLQHTQNQMLPMTQAGMLHTAYMHIQTHNSAVPQAFQVVQGLNGRHSMPESPSGHRCP